jgi:succinate dehydrogenase / fumarate reductase cytochrome b subunit
MSTAAPATPALDAADSASASRRDARGAFIRSRLASILGLAPLGVWVVVHLWNNLAAFEGGDAWQAAVTGYPHPFAQAVTGVIVLVPLGIHAAWGVARLVSSRPNNLRYRTYANLKYVLQRLSAVGVLLFVGAHLWLALLKPRLIVGRPEAFADLAQEMHFHPPTLVVYVLGTLGVAYHLANGALTSCMTWGVVTSRRGLQRLEWAALTLFVVLLAMAWGGVYALWAAGAPAAH